MSFQKEMLTLNLNLNVLIGHHLNYANDFVMCQSASVIREQVTTLNNLHRLTITATKYTDRTC